MTRPLDKFNPHLGPAGKGVIADILAAPQDDGHACHCLCAARHPENRNCTGYMGSDGVRVWFNSKQNPLTPAGVPICRACINAYPELQDPELDALGKALVNLFEVVCVKPLQRVIDHLREWRRL